MFSPDIFKVRVFWRGSKFVFGVQTLVYVSSNVQVQNSSVGYIRIQSTNKLWVTTCTFWKQSSVVWNSHISLKSDRALKCLWTTHNPIKTNFGGITQLQTRLKVMKTVNWMMLAARQKKVDLATRMYCSKTREQNFYHKTLKLNHVHILCCVSCLGIEIICVGSTDMGPNHLRIGTSFMAVFY